MKMQYSRLLLISLVAILAIALGLGVAAQSPVQPAKEKKPPRNFDVKADLMKVVWGEERKVLLTGNVVFTQEDTKIQSAYVEWDRKAETALFPGKVTITTPEAVATSDKGQAFFKKRIGILEGSVNMIYTPKEEKPVDPKDKEDPQTSLRKETTMTCTKLEYDYKNKIAVATGGVTIIQKERTVTADKVIFDQKQELLTLNGNVKVVDDQGQEFNAPGEAKISIKKGQEWIEAPNPTAKFKVEMDE